MTSPLHPNDHPLGMTVHSMPQPNAITAREGTRTRLGRWKMLMVFLVCASPVVASYFTYYVLRPEGRRNFGELIDPQRPLPTWEATQLDGKPTPMTTLKGQWLLVSVASGACDAACTQQLYIQRQLREGLGKEKDRLDWVWLIIDSAPVPDTLLPALKDATVLRVDGKALAQWLQPQAGHTLAQHLYLVDPLGNWMMRFPAQIDAKQASSVRKDLERLLRASNAWDKAGR